MTDPPRATDPVGGPVADFALPGGDLTFSRVVPDASAALTAALDRRHTGYAVLTPSDALVLADDTRAVVCFEAGIPTHALAAGDRGAGALAAAATPGPLRITLHATDTAVSPDAAQIAPDTPARRLAGDDDLAARTLAAAPDALDPSGERVPEAGDDLDAVDAFLADEDAISRLKSQAREEAERRAREWGFDEFVDE
jgi:hypothetical protein